MQASPQMGAYVPIQVISKRCLSLWQWKQNLFSMDNRRVAEEEETTNAPHQEMALPQNSPSPYFLHHLTSCFFYHNPQGGHWLYILISYAFSVSLNAFPYIIIILHFLSFLLLFILLLIKLSGTSVLMWFCCCFFSYSYIVQFLLVITLNVINICNH